MRATFSPHGAVAFSVWLASQLWVKATPLSRAGMLQNLFADLADEHAPEKSHCLIFTLLDPVFGEGTVDRYWEMWSWVSAHVFIRGG